MYHSIFYPYSSYLVQKRNSFRATKPIALRINSVNARDYWQKKSFLEREAEMVIDLFQKSLTRADIVELNNKSICLYLDDNQNQRDFAEYKRKTFYFYMKIGNTLSSYRQYAYSSSFVLLTPKEKKEDGRQYRQDIDFIICHATSYEPHSNSALKEDNCNKHIAFGIAL
ncbi:hypothetical protein BD560DRAFT_492546 [Blakeslea trispora]|nr:hypothetical protein BD560DRAFT_492546 [Blakeslea trispora]